MRIVILLIVLLLIWYLLKLFERKNIYFPTRRIEATPKDIGLDYEDVFLKTDGARLNGWFIPAHSAGVTVLFCHGNGGNISHRLHTISMFHGMGYSIFIFDYRDYGRSKGRISEEGTYRDALTAYNYIIGRDDVDSENVCIFGRSLGAPIAIDLAARVNKGMLIYESSFTSTMDMAKVVYGVRIPARFLSYRYDALSKIEKVTIPKLIMHGRGDKMIPFEHGERLFRAAKPPKEFYEASAGHEDIYLNDEYWKRVGEFIERYQVVNSKR
ncbi:hypothetical protein CH333_04005 [candidate division WOR-3 bacterium JGI_Cruoil_03_44_89]|uniref:AB hydrolase-1 domain-containing protein n=1 Tax=candidate division WOR-3 bacterium JGI_Cruoil_03_44_89 TaxID=1973748 RepID=A0A235BVE2_UNCW3|nr:MAG: hypothetical protein CH333_04005 [candidate division WOR-3 bacterium JGI_Cruoil_03_44_89]